MSSQVPSMPLALRTPIGLAGRAARRDRKGFTILEAIATLMLVGMLIVLFGAAFPMALSAGGSGAAYNQAALIAQHKIDQLRQAGFSQLNQPTLYTMGIVDSTPSVNGTMTFTNTDTLVDNGTAKGFFGPGSTGTITIGQALAGQGNNAPPTLRALQVTVTVSWLGAGLHPGTFSTHTIIAAP